MGEEINRLNEIDSWYEFHKRDRSPFFTALFLGGTGIKSPKVSIDNRMKNFAYFCDGTIAIDNSEKLRLKEIAVKELEKNPDYLWDLMQKCYEENKEHIKRWKKINEINFEGLDNGKIAELYEEYINIIFSYGIYVTLPLFVEDYLEDFVREKLGDDYDKVTTPVREGSVYTVKKEILKLAVKGKISPDDLSYLTRNFSWMKNVSFKERYYDEKYYKEEVSKVNISRAQSDLIHMEVERKENEKTVNQIINETDDKYLKAMIKTLNEAIFFRSFRTELFYSSPRHLKNFLMEVGRRLGLGSYTDQFYLYPDEVLEDLRNSKETDIDLIESRRSGYSYMSDLDNKYHKYDDELAKEALKIYENKNKENIKDTIKGTVAYRGSVTGKVKIVRSVSEIDKVKNGDILVTTSTNVNYMPILDKVRAIVTEEGGILSHASVISRELKIPCIIGIKNITKILEDNDMINVDANNGTLRKV